jgi:tetratricopeptide (TPR) repeat protein
MTSLRRPRVPHLIILVGLLQASLLSAQAPKARANSDPASDPRVEQLHDEARQLQSKGDLAGAAAKYEAMLRIAPRLLPAYNNLGSLYLQLGNYPKAIEMLERGLKVNPNLPSASALLGIAYFQSGDQRAARPHLEAAVRANPDDTNAAMFLANCLTKLGEFHSAARTLEQLAQKQPRNPQIFYLLGKVYIQLSESALAKVNEIDPNSVWAHQISSDMAEGFKNYDGAILEMKKALAIAPRQPGLHYKLGDLYRETGQWDAAFEEFSAELTNDPHNCRVAWKLGDVLLLESARPEEALGHIDRALAACPDLAEARLDRARLLVKLHRNEDAVPDLLASAKAMPGEPSIHYLLAQAYRALGRGQEAQAEMQIFSRLDEAARAATAARAREAIQSKGGNREDQPQQR